MDILTDENDDLLIEKGDFVIGNSVWQHIKALLISLPGHFRQFPALGFGLRCVLKGVWEPHIIARDIQAMLRADGHKKKVITGEPGEITIQ